MRSQTRGKSFSVVDALQLLEICKPPVGVTGGAEVAAILRSILPAQIFAAIFRGPHEPRRWIVPIPDSLSDQGELSSLLFLRFLQGLIHFRLRRRLRLTRWQCWVRSGLCVGDLHDDRNWADKKMHRKGGSESDRDGESCHRLLTIREATYRILRGYGTF